uniref:BTB domain-containing protein n=1 Tax=Graphocephala atropunctata TaxID=36148 RepID=A0A1B6KAS2_9HEMI
MATAVASTSLNPQTSQGRPLPDYIDYWLSPDTPLDFNVPVGNPDLCTQERIRAVKWMLIVLSKMLRAMLLQRKMMYQSEISVPGLDHATYQNILVYMYGHDDTSSLQLEAAVSLLCVAELRRSFVCKKVPKLWETATEIVHCQIEGLFFHAQFPTVSPKVLLHIVQQDRLNVGEIDVWRAAFNWATH